MVTIKIGSILDAAEDVIGHQVNCFGAAGGLAAAVFDEYPEAGFEYDHLCNRSNPWTLLGLTKISNRQQDGKVIANIFGQYHPGADYRPDDLERALRILGKVAHSNGWSVALPWKLSCGICGGDWNEVLETIKRTMADVKCVIYRREGDR